MSRRRVLHILIAVFCLWLGGFALFIHYMQSFARVEPSHCEAIVVFTGKGRRIHTGYDLFRKMNAKGFLVSGVQEGVDLHDLELTEEMAKKDSPDHITLGYDAYNTHTNALETALWVRAHKFQSICLVTGFFHMPRSFLELKAFLPQTQIVPHCVLPLKPWWASSHQILHVMGEYHKFCLTYVIQRCVME